MSNINFTTQAVDGKCAISTCNNKATFIVYLTMADGTKVAIKSCEDCLTKALGNKFEVRPIK